MSAGELAASPYRHFYQNGKVGLVSRRGNKIVVPAVYDDIESFENGYAIVGLDGKKGVIDANGKLTIPCIYDEVVLPLYFREEQDVLPRVRRGSKWGRVDYNGQIVNPIQYDGFSELGDFASGRYMQMRVGKLLGVTEVNGRVILEPKYRRIRARWVAKTKMFIVTDSHGSLGFFDTSGVLLFPFGREIIPIKSNYAIMRVDSIWYLASKSSRTFLGKFDDVYFCDQRLVIVSTPSGCGVIDLEGNLKIPAIYRGVRAEKIGESMFFVVEDKNRKEGILDESGKVIVPIRYNRVTEESNWFWGLTGETSVAYDSCGRIMLELPYSEVKRLDSFCFRVRSGGKYGMVNERNGLVLDTFFTIIEKLAQGLYNVRDTRGQEGVVDEKGDIVLHLEYKSVHKIRDGLFFVQDKNYQREVVDSNGRVLITDEGVYWREFVDGKIELDGRAKRYADRNGRIERPEVHTRQYKRVLDFTCGRAAVEDSAGYWGYIDQAGREVVPCVFIAEGYYSGGLAAVCYVPSIANNRESTYEYEFRKASSRGFNEQGNDTNSYRWGYIDRDGRVVIPFMYEAATDF